MTTFSILDFRFSIALSIGLLGLTSGALGQRVEVASMAKVNEVAAAHGRGGYGAAQFIPHRWPDQPLLIGAPDARVTKKFAVPVYFDRPPGNYEPIGWVFVPQFEQSLSDRTRALTEMAVMAKEFHADAIWLRDPRPGRYVEALAFCWKQ